MWTDICGKVHSSNQGKRFKFAMKMRRKERKVEISFKKKMKELLTGKQKVTLNQCE